MAFGLENIGGLVSIIVAAFAFLLVPPVPCHGFQRTLTLESWAFPINEPVKLSHLLERDSARHRRRILSSSSRGALYYPLTGTSDLSLGLYYTRIKIGSPPVEFTVQFDTGSDLSWLWCVSCQECRTWTGIANITVQLYDAARSSSFSNVTCGDKQCPTKTVADSCKADDYNPCPYSILYGDLTKSSGFLVKDLLHYDTITFNNNNRIVKSTSPIIFGCSYAGSVFTSTDQADGVLGFGRHGISAFSQLVAAKKSPNVFSHCLKGDRYGGGFVVLDEVVVPNMIYSPMIPSQWHYVLDLQRMSVNGKVLAIDPFLFSGATHPGARVDSGTSLAYLGSEVFDQFMTTIYESTSAVQLPSSVDACYQVTSSITEQFPQVSLGFAGNVEMTLLPQDYLIYQGVTVQNTTSQVWCMGFRRNFQKDQPTILGEILLRNKFIVYDIAGQRIGWANYDCSGSTPFNVSTTNSAVRRPVQLHWSCLCGVFLFFMNFF